MGSRRTETILSLIKEAARLQTEHDRWLEDNPGGNASGLRAQIAGIRQQYEQLMTDEERAAGFHTT
jgi:hypothetical protein